MTEQDYLAELLAGKVLKKGIMWQAKESKEQDDGFKVFDRQDAIKIFGEHNMEEVVVYGHRSFTEYETYTEWLARKQGETK